jgi:hypothetical protein
MTHCESCDSPPYFQHLPAPTNHPICKAMLINQVLVDSVLHTNYLTIILTIIPAALAIPFVILALCQPSPLPAACSKQLCVALEGFRKR